MPTALVTDPRTRLGTAFARRFGATGHDLVLAGHGERELGFLAAELADRHDITVEVIVADLADAAQRALVEDRLLDDDRAPVDLLVNNASADACAGFLTTPVDRVQADFDLRATSVLRLTHAALAGMMRRRRGAVINVFGSGRAWWGLGRCTVQDAFIRTLSQNLADALCGTPVHVMALCVGTTTPWLTNGGADEVVRRALRDVAQRRTVSGSRLQLMARWLTSR
ncbi:SDR family NAD(P)-dependent oxidoreductase [Lentzea sp. NEAU-D13]|uniref:SDR family NAD(P)-dependent oxidoreductase n=1 Tax=Lentzea alba TaxID=2714351 RepID=A0A7C9RVG1_9PSEU|nr:SDR family NAD(P)-dependent oxidoreductase [Lentzea alba]NGY63748.1 SDR family NAD(P)-dependent oxidoreductase [Lentzea alba]